VGEVEPGARPLRVVLREACLEDAQRVAELRLGFGEAAGLAMERAEVGEGRGAVGVLAVEVVAAELERLGERALGLVVTAEPRQRADARIQRDRRRARRPL